MQKCIFITLPFLYPKSYLILFNYKTLEMKKVLFITVILSATFGLGYAFSNFISAKTKQSANTKKVTGIGGIFFKCKDPGKMRDWYKTHLGLNTDKYGTNFEWRQGSDTTKKGFTQWGTFSETTKYFAPSAKDFMINYRVEDVESLVEQLKKDGVTIVDSIEKVEYGKFVHILDVEGNKVELWEPNDIEYDKIVGGRTK